MSQLPKPPIPDVPGNNASIAGATTAVQGLYGLALHEDAELPAPLPSELQPSFPQYEILSLLARGGMGLVFKARHRALDRLVALKLLPPELSCNREFAARFEGEARAMARLHHPNIVTIYDFGSTPDGRLFLVMELVEGSDLAALLREGAVGNRARTPFLDPLKIAAELCEALAYAHAEGVLHRDIKPGNVLVDGRGRPKLADFGLARMVGEGLAEATGLTQSGFVIGTPAYMAPPQREGKPADHRADRYSLGVLLSELLCEGRAPGGGESPRTEIDSWLAAEDPSAPARTMKAGRPV